MICELDFSDKIAIQKINDFLDQSLYAEYYQSIEWNQIRTEKMKYYLYYIDNSDRIVWVCNLLEKELDGQKIIYAPRGPVLNYCNQNDLICFLSGIFKWCYQKDYARLIINPIIKEETLNLIPPQYKYLLTGRTDYSHLLDSCKLAIMPVIFDEEEQLFKLPAKHRQNTRRSYRKGLTQKQSTNIDLNAFYQLYLETSERHKFHPHSIEYFQRIIDVFQDKLVFFEVWYQDIPLAMTIDLKYKDKLIYLYGVSSSSHRNLLGMYNMHFEVIKYCIKNKIPYYDFGGVFCEENDVDNKDYGLYQFKKGYCYEGFQDIVPDIQFLIKEDVRND